MPSSHLILCLLCPHPLSPPAPNPSQHQSLFQWINSSHKVAKYWNFSFSINPSKEHQGLISFKMDWLDLLAVQRTLKNLLQKHSTKASIIQRSAFFTVQLSHPYMTTGKTIALARWTFVGKVMSLLFNMLPRLVITFLPRSKRLLISWLQSPSAVIWEPPKIKSATVSTSQNFLCRPFVVSHPTPTLPPGNHWSFSIPTVFPFLECHINGIIWYVSLWTWFLSSFLSLTKWNEFERHSCVACIKIVQLSLHLIPEHFQHSKNKSHTC